MAEQIIRITFPSTLLDSPIINQLIRAYEDLTVNILRAQVDEEKGWLEVQLIGNPGMIESAIDWLHEKGIDVQSLGA